MPTDFKLTSEFIYFLSKNGQSQSEYAKMHILIIVVDYIGIR